VTALTLIHVAISLVAIASGFVVLYGFLTAKRFGLTTTVFLGTSVLTSASGFLFPYHGITPGIVVGVLSLLILALAIPARYRSRLSGAWRKTYVVTATVALYLNVFVLVAQLFQKVAFLKELAPTQSEPPFAITQLLVLVVFVVLGVRAFRVSPGFSVGS
jgi:hypothetical protein